MAVLTVVTAARAGAVFALAAAAGGGDSFANTGKEVLVINNASGGAITLTLDLQATVDGAAAVDPTVSVGAGVQKIVGPFPTALYNDGNGRVNLTYSGVTSLTVGVLLTPAT